MAAHSQAIIPIRGGDLGTFHPLFVDFFDLDLRSSESLFFGIQSFSIHIVIRESSHSPFETRMWLDVSVRMRHHLIGSDMNLVKEMCKTICSEASLFFYRFDHNNLPVRICPVDPHLRF
jgi:hypothetical protein